MRNEGSLEIGLEVPELDLTTRQALARDLEAVVARHLPTAQVRLLTAQDTQGREWLRVVVPLGKPRQG